MCGRRDRNCGGAGHRGERQSARLIDELDQSDRVSAIRRNAGLGSIAACGRESTSEQSSPISDRASTAGASPASTSPAYRGMRCSPPRSIRCSRWFSFPRPRPRREVATAVAAAVVVLVAVSRVAIDAHSASEVLSGCAVGVLAAAVATRSIDRAGGMRLSLAWLAPGARLDAADVSRAAGDGVTRLDHRARNDLFRPRPSVRPRRSASLSYGLPPAPRP